MRKIINFAILICSILLIVFIFNIITDERGKSDDPVRIVRDFILLAEEGKIKRAEALLAPRDNNVDYFYKFKDNNKGKDLFYIDYNYKGNDNVIELTFELLRDISTSEKAIVKVTTNYLLQKSIFEKDVTLIKVDGKWKIYEYIFMPVKVK